MQLFEAVVMLISLQIRSTGKHGQDLMDLVALLRAVTFVSLIQRSSCGQRNGIQCSARQITF